MRRAVPLILLVPLGLALLVGCPESELASSDRRPASTEPAAQATATGWTAAEIQVLESLSLDALGPVPSSPSNRVADDERAAELGHLLFFDVGLSANGLVSCATCHQPERFFTDGLPVSRGVGEMSRNAPTLVGAAYSPWMFWDGRRDSLWAQALAPLEAGVEMGSTRLEVVRHVATGARTRALYARVFGRPAPFDDETRFPRNAGPFADRGGRDVWARMHPADRLAVDRAFANVGKAIAAYERLLGPGESRFDRYVRRLRERPGADPETLGLDAQEIEGLRLFIDPARTQCLRCHNGPLLTNQSFHRVGTSLGDGPLPDLGRFLGLQAVLVDPFNCLGPYSDAEPEACGPLRFLNRDHVAEESGKFKSPTLRGLSATAPYMHDGRFATLAEVLEHYRRPPDSAADPHELVALELDAEEMAALEAFLRTLEGPVAAGARWLASPREDHGESSFE